MIKIKQPADPLINQLSVHNSFKNVSKQLDTKYYNKSRNVLNKTNYMYVKLGCNVVNT